MSSQRVNMEDLSGSSFVKRHIRLLRDPETVQQDRKLTSDSDDSLVPGLLAAS